MQLREGGGEGCFHKTMPMWVEEGCRRKERENGLFVWL